LVSGRDTRRKGSRKEVSPSKGFQNVVKRLIVKKRKKKHIKKGVSRGSRKKDEIIEDGWALWTKTARNKEKKNTAESMWGLKKGRQGSATGLQQK